MQKAGCPGKETLAALVAGRLEDTLLQEVAAHLDRCPACRAEAGQLDAGSEPMLAALRQGKADSDGGEDTDRNLLFAVLALQADLIDRDRFVQACTLWASRKDTPLAELLVEQGWLSEEDRGDVERLLQRKLKRHNGDAHASLAEVAGPQARASLAGIRDADVERSLAGLSTVHPPDALPVEEGLQRAGRNLLYEEIGHGGMGRVLRGRDTQLGRDLAVKLLRPEFRGDAGLRRRFVEEAQVGGQLQHPGTVPVYELGDCDDGCPYFTMKLVKGQTLAALLHQRTAPAVELPRWLGIFEAVCQAVAYAHSKGVIHRDLKPANVMVGAFGEVQVMDWGLAKVLAHPQGEDPEATTAGTLIRTVRSDSTAEGEGRTGVVGTPAFMAPEQARGQERAVDERADVFGLGAILCVILTGQPPHAGARGEEAIERAAKGDLSEALARLDGCGAEAELVALARDCLAPRREERPRDAGEVAKRLSAYLAGVQERLRQAGLERAAAEARAQEEARTRRVAEAKAAVERRARRLTLGLAAALVGLLLLGGAAGLYLQQQGARRQIERAQRLAATEAAMQRADELRRRGRWAEMRTLLEQARDHLGEDANEEVGARLEVALHDAVLVGDLDSVRLKKATWVEGTFDFEGADREYAEVFRQGRVVVEGDDPQKVAFRVRSSAVREQLLAALDDWAFSTTEAHRRAWLLEVAWHADTQPWRDRLRDPTLWADRKRLEGLTEQAKADELSPPVVVALGMILKTERSVALLREVYRRHPDDFWVNLTLGTLLSRARQGEGIEYLRAAVALRRNAAAAHNNLALALQSKYKVDEAIVSYREALEIDPRHAYAHNNLGYALQRQGKVEEAIACFRKALELNRRYASAHSNLGLALADKGKVEEALACCRKALGIDPRDAEAHNNLGVVLMGQGKVEEAIECYQKALALEPRFANAHNNLGNALKTKGKVDEAIECYRKAIELEPRIAKVHYHLGNVLKGKGKVEEAIACYRQALEIEPRDAAAHNNLGNALDDQGKADEAIECYRKALEIDPHHVNAHINLGTALRSKGKLEQAIVCFRTAIRLDPRNVLAHSNLGLALRRKGEVEGAIVCFRQALALDPRYTSAHYNLGLALQGKGQLDEAIACYRKVLEQDPQYAEAHCNLGHALRDQGRFSEALVSLRQGHALGSVRPNWPYNSAAWVRQCQRLVELDRLLDAVLHGNAEPASAREWLELAILCRFPCKRLHATAVRFATAAFSTDPSLANDLSQQRRYQAACSAILAAAGQAEDARLLPDRVALKLRRQAWHWLRADLVLWTQLVERGEVGPSRLARTLAHWQKDSDLAAVRDPAALARLDADERQQWRRLWQEVDALLQKVTPKKK
jgi:tetratricopeptide (TPR) repeat protein/tRNA A-37 threonylcarbamoyl transferase component Bud32